MSKKKKLQKKLDELSQWYEQVTEEANQLKEKTEQQQATIDRLVDEKLGLIRDIKSKTAYIQSLQENNDKQQESTAAGRLALENAKLKQEIKNQGLLILSLGLPYLTALSLQKKNKQ